MTRRYLPQFDIETDSFDRLPRVCLARAKIDDSPIRIHRGAAGFYKTHPSTDVDRFNKERGITDIQVECMVVGSMFGWDTPGADPAHFDDNGRFIPKEKRA